MWGIGLAANAVNRSAGYALHLAFVAVLSALAAVQVLKWAVGVTQPETLILLTVTASATFTLAYARFRPVAEWARYAAILPAIALALFVFSSSSSGLLGGSRSVASSGGTDDDLPPIVFVLLDEFPTKTLLDDNDEIDKIRFPHLASFADDANWYRRFTTVAPLSNQAIPAVLTGNPPEIVEPIWTEYPQNLFSLLAPNYNLTAFESFTKLCGLETCTEGPPGSSPNSTPRYRGLAAAAFGLWRDRISVRSAEVRPLDDFSESVTNVIPGEDMPLLPTGEELRVRPERQQAFLDSLVPDEDPSLYFLHLVLPHSPFRFYADGEPYDAVFSGGSSGYPNSEGNDAGPAVAAFAEQRHIQQARYTDTLVGEIMERLVETDLYDESLVIVMADHGTSFRLDTDFRLLTGDMNLDAIAYAPLLIKPPGQTEGRVDDTNLMGIDVLPTLAETIGVEIPWEVEGHPAGSAEIAARGAEKFILDLGGSLGYGISLRGVIDFEGHFPTAASRWIAPVRPDDYPLAGLLRPLGFDDLVGRSLDDLTGGSRSSRSAAVRGLDRLRNPGGQTPLGWAQGVLDDPPVDGVVVVEVNGEVVTAAPLFEDAGVEGNFAALLPSQTLDEMNEIRIGLMVDGSVTEVAVG